MVQTSTIELLKLRESYGEDKNVVDIDPEVKAKLEETNGEYGKKN